MFRLFRGLGVRGFLGFSIEDGLGFRRVTTFGLSSRKAQLLRCPLL